MAIMSAIECPTPLKWLATGDTSVLLRAMSCQRLFILWSSGCPDVPTYCWPHFRHVIGQTMLKDLQEALVFTLSTSLVVWLENSSVANNTGQVLHLIASHGRLLGGSCRVDTGVAQTRRSLKFLGWWEAIDDGNKMPSLVVPRHEGSSDGAWWSSKKLVTSVGVWSLKVCEQTCPGFTRY